MAGASFTPEKNIPDLSGKVILITGGSSNRINPSDMSVPIADGVIYQERPVSAQRQPSN